MERSSLEETTEAVAGELQSYFGRNAQAILPVHDARELARKVIRLAHQPGALRSRRASTNPHQLTLF